LIDGALVVASDPADPTRPQATVACTPEAIVAAAQSKYCLVPMNALLAQLPKAPEFGSIPVAKHPDGEASRWRSIPAKRSGSLAIVGLPCQIHGLRLAQAQNLTTAKPIGLAIGLFCGFNVRRQGTLHLLHKLGIQPDQVATLEYRGGPWPGGFRVTTHDGRQAFIPKHHYTYIHLMYAPRGCWYCPDLTAEFADLSVGDYWADDAQGYSMVMTRTETGQAAWDAAVAGNQIVAKPITYSQVTASHQHLLDYKKKGVQVRRSLAGRRPVEGYSLPRLSTREWIDGALFYNLMRFSSSGPGRRLIGWLPLGVTGRLSARARTLVRTRR